MPSPTSSPALRVGFALTLLASAGLLASCSSDPTVSEADCHRVREHIVDLQLANVAGATPSAGTRAELAKHRAALLDAHASSVESCVAQRDPDYVRCALRAQDTSELAGCRGAESAGPATAEVAR